MVEKSNCAFPTVDKNIWTRLSKSLFLFFRFLLCRWMKIHAKHVLVLCWPTLITILWTTHYYNKIQSKIHDLWHDREVVAVMKSVVTFLWLKVSLWLTRLYWLLQNKSFIWLLCSKIKIYVLKKLNSKQIKSTHAWLCPSLIKKII